MPFDEEEIKSQIKKVLSYSQAIENPEIDNIIDEWYNAKSSFIRRMHGLIYEYPVKVSFPLGEKERHERVCHFLDTVSLRFQNQELMDFISAQEQGFFKNLTVKDYQVNNGKIIKKGTKLIRSFKYFVSNERSLADLQSEASRIIQEDKIEGTLCLSVHPLDYLSSSETTYNWRSCHSLDGEYRAGNFSYMMDKCTVICYLKGDNEVKLPNFPDTVLWNSKKWRMLLFFSESNDIIFAGRQYPFETTNGLDFILNNCLPKSKLIYEDSNAYYSDWTQVINNIKVGSEDFALDEAYLPIGRTLVNINDVVEDAVEKNTAAHYNDLLYSSCYKPFYTQKCYRGLFNNRLGTYSNDTKIKVGHKVLCLKCGKNEVSGGCDTMMCDDCELKFGSADNDYFTYCDCCGDRIFVDDGYYTDDEEIVCQDCYNKYYRRCESCGKVVHEDFIRYDENSDEYICTDCYDERHDWHNRI